MKFTINNELILKELENLNTRQKWSKFYYRHNVMQLCAALCCACGRVAYSCCYALVWADLQHKLKIKALMKVF